MEEGEGERRQEGQEEGGSIPTAPWCLHDAERSFNPMHSVSLWTMCTLCTECALP